MDAKLPVDASLVVISATPPCGDFTTQRAEEAYLPASEALACDQASFDLSDVEPASMLGRVVHREATPQGSTALGTKGDDQRHLEG